MICAMPWSLRNLGNATEVSSKTPPLSFRKYGVSSPATTRKTAVFRYCSERKKGDLANPQPIFAVHAGSNLIIPDLRSLKHGPEVSRSNTDHSESALSTHRANSVAARNPPPKMPVINGTIHMLAVFEKELMRALPGCPGSYAMVTDSSCL